MGIRGFERRLERMVEGAFARAFRSGLRPVELGRRLVREMDDNRSVDVRGRTLVPNSFTVALSPSDLEQFEDVRESLTRELGEAAREHARDEGYTFMGPVDVQLVPDDKLHTGAFQITGRLAQGEGGAGAGSLVLPSGDRFALDESVITIGRHPDSTMVLADPNVSRNHAEIRPQGNGFVVVDLGSTNGSRVNGVRVDTAGARGRRRARRSATPGCGSRPPDRPGSLVPDQLLNLLKICLLAAALPLLPPRAAGRVGRGRAAQGRGRAGEEARQADPAGGAPQGRRPAGPADPRARRS